MLPRMPAEFERDYGCTEADWLRWLPGAVGAHALHLAPGAAQVEIDGGRLQLRWSPLPLRRIALVRLPRLQVGFSFDAVGDDSRQRFMRRFDLFMQRGGG
jgi:hypothetical protein